MDLSSVHQIVVSQVSDDRVVVSWVGKHGPGSSEIVDEDSGYVDPEDVLWWLLRQGADREEIRMALKTTYPVFDLDAEIAFVTMSDRAEQRRVDVLRRQDLRAEFKNRRVAPPG